MARPTDYTDELAATILQRLAAGESLRRICADDDMPGRETVREWLIRPAAPEFPGQYARARELQADEYFDEIIEIADDASADYTEKQLGADGPTVSVVDHEHIARSKLRVDARKWIVSKLAPKKYGDKVAHEHAGPDGGAIPHAVTANSDQAVKDDVVGIFGAAAAAILSALASVGAAAGAGGAAEPVTAEPAQGDVRPAESAEQPVEGDRVLSAGADGGSGQEPAAPAPGEALVEPERSVFSFDDDL